MSSSMSNMLSVNHLRYAKAWFAIGCLLILTIIVLSITNVSVPVKSVMLHDKVLHCVAYCALMGWFAQIFRHLYARILLAVFFVAMGVGIEYLQAMLPSREFEVLDMGADLAGVLLAWILVHTRIGNILEWFEKTCLIRAQPVA